MRHFLMALAFVAGLSPERAQWLNYPTRNAPRTKDGKPDISALLPRTKDGTPDNGKRCSFRAKWQSSTNRAPFSGRSSPMDGRFPKIRILPGRAIQSGDGKATPIPEAAHITERFRRHDNGHMDIQITIDDPKAYTKPWTITESPSLLVDTDLLESDCEENNKEAQHIVGK